MTLGPGAGTPYGCGEDTDYILRCIERGLGVYFWREFCVFHDQVDVLSNTDGLRRVRGYSVGYGRVLRKHEYGVSHIGPRAGRAIVRGVLQLATGNASGARLKFQWAAGALRGYFARSNVMPVPELGREQDRR